MSIIINKYEDAFSEFISEQKNNDLYVLGYGQAFHDVKKTYPVEYTNKIACFSLHFAIKGEGKLVLGGKEYSIKKNRLFIVFPDIKFQRYSSLKNPWEIIWLNFGGIKASEYLERIGLSPINPVLDIDDPHIISIINDLIVNSVKYKKSKDIYALTAFYNILTELTEKYSIIGQEKKFHNDHYLLQTLSYLETNYPDCNLSIKEISKFLHLNTSYFSRYFSQNMKVCFANYLNMFRIKKACYLIEQNPSIMINELSAMVGFKDPLYFSRLFKKHIYSSPSEYIKNTSLIQSNDIKA